MVQINFAQKEIQCKIVYYGPGMSGKTTNLELVHGKVPDENRGELTSIATTGERTLYFDYMPLDLGQIAGIQTKFQLYTVPGQIYYKSTRRLVLQGVDGIVFVADSAASKLRENQESFEDLEQNLKEMGKTLQDVPIIIQYNKRDLPDAMPIEELEEKVNPHGFPYTEAVANSGDGVFPTLKQLSQRVLESVNKGGLSASKPKSAARPAAVKAPTAQAPAGEAPAASAAPAAPAPQAAPAAPIAASYGQSAPASTAVASPPGGGQGGTSYQASGPSHHAGGAPGGSFPPAGPGSYQGRSMQDRVVRVSGLGDEKSSAKTAIIVVLGVLIAAAAYFVVTKVM